VLPAGSLTPFLAQLSAGDVVQCSKPFGTFRSTPRPGYWICTGTGLDPFLSMFRSGLSDGKVLIHGSRAMEGFFFREDLAAAMGSRYVRCCSRMTAPRVYHGRLTAFLESLEGLPADAEYLLCGHSEMIAAVREILLVRGVPFDRVLSEVYF
jgi:ferredoxin/flavodoxin---NADP+ reductase